MVIVKYSKLLVLICLIASPLRASAQQSGLLEPLDHLRSLNAKITFLNGRGMAIISACADDTIGRWKGTEKDLGFFNQVSAVSELKLEIRLSSMGQLAFLRKNNAIKKLHIGTIPSASPELSNWISLCPQLESVTITAMDFDDFSIEPITVLPNLKSLSLIGRRLKVSELRFLRDFPNLTHIDLHAIGTVSLADLKGISNQLAIESWRLRVSEQEFEDIKELMSRRFPKANVIFEVVGKTGVTKRIVELSISQKANSESRIKAEGVKSEKKATTGTTND